MALLEQPQINPHGPITPEEAKSALSTGVWGDSPALRLVIQDATRAENFAASKQFVMGWNYASSLYQSPFTSRYWPGTQIEASNIPFYTVANAVNSLAPQVVSGLFYENPPFMIQQRPGTKAQAARAIGALLGFQLEDINFREEIRLGCVNAILFGTNIWKWGWESFSRERKMYVREKPPVTLPNPLQGEPPVQIQDSDEEIIEQTVDEYVDRPTFENIVNLRHVLVDPTLSTPDIRKAKYVIHRLFLTWEELDRLRDRPGFDIPSKEKLLELFLPPKEPVEMATAEGGFRNPQWDAGAQPRYEESTIDPFNQPLEVLERWDNNKYIVVLQKKLVICNDSNPYGTVPFLSVGWWDVPESFYGLGLSRTIGSEQRLQQGITNLWVDNASLNLNGVYVRVKGKSIPTQSIRIAPGKIVEVDADGDFKTLERLPAVPEAGQHIAMSQARAEQVSGANEISSQGIAGASGHSNIARSAAGANLLGSGAGNKPADFVEKLADQVIVPFLYHAHELNCSLLPLATIRHILNNELQHEFMKESGDLLEILNARVKFSILAASKMQARRNMATSLPILVQFLTAPEMQSQLAIQGLKVNVAEVLRMFWEVSDWRNMNDVIVPMTQQDEQRWQASQPGAQQQIKNQGAQQMMQQKHQDDLELVDAQNMAKGAREVLRHALEASETPEAITGEPGSTGFGSNV